eukprot:SAG11_NODE_28667_length_319_cov_0.704545_1_plen_85_part_10
MPTAKLLLATALIGEAAASLQPDVHVSPAGPHTSLASALLAVRGRPNATVVVHAGRYELSTPVVIGPEHPGLTVRAAASGGRPVH